MNLGEIEKKYIPTAFEKKHLAEFNTPMFLIDRMLNTIPSDFWKNRFCKVFEPCAGKGFIVYSLFNRFYIGLKEIIPDDKERIKHIIEHCLYFADINPENVAVIKSNLISLSSFPTTIMVNAWTGNSLHYSTKHRFDLVISNPPFNGTEDNKNIIWPKFVTTALKEWTQTYLLFITPPGWRKPNKTQSKYNGLFNLMTKENSMRYLQMHNKKDGRTIFKCNTFFDWYLIQREKIYANTVIDEAGIQYSDIDFSKWNWFPSANILLIKQITCLDKDDEPCPVIYSRSAYGTDKSHMSQIKDAMHPFPCVHSTPKGSPTRFMYSSEDCRGHFGQSKVIFGESGIYNPIIDMEGKYGLTHCAIGIKIDSLEEGEKICKAITSIQFENLIKTSCLLSSYRIEWSIFKQFKRTFYEII